MARLHDVIRLNVGGTIMDTKRSTLYLITDSKLASWFSQETEESLDRDKDNNIFLDLNPKYFNIILNYLRAKSTPQTKFDVPFPKLKPEEVRPFLELAMQLGLEKEFSIDDEKFIPHSPWIIVKGNSKTAKHNGRNLAVGYALSDPPHPQGIILWHLKLESLKSEMFVGVLKADTEPYDNRSYDMKGSNGWLLKVGEREIGSAWSDGKEIYYLISDVKNGDTLKIILNSVTAQISLAVSPVREFHMFLPNSDGWRLHINLFHQTDTIQIISP